MLKKFVMQNLQVSDCDKLFSFHTRGIICKNVSTPLSSWELSNTSPERSGAAHDKLQAVV